MKKSERTRNSQYNPAMLRLARELRGMTQKEFAATADINPGSVSRYEHRGTPPIDFLVRASDVTRLPVEFFEQDDRIYGLGIGELFHRKRHDVPAITLQRLHAHVNVRRMHLERLLRSVDIPDCRIPTVDLPEDFSGSPEAVAQFLRKYWSLPSGRVDNVVDAIEEAGGVICEFDFETNKVDAISHWAPGMPPMFFVNVTAPADRVRFTLCHELGHMVMHQTSVAYVELTKAAQGEDQANSFASEFLMPAADIAFELGNNLSLSRLADLKPRWRVSMAALLKRAGDLGRISERKSRLLWSELSRLGYRRREPVNLDISREQPRTMRDIIATYRDELGYSDGELCNLLLCEETDLSSWYDGRRGLHLVSA